MTSFGWITKLLEPSFPLQHLGWREQVLCNLMVAFIQPLLSNSLTSLVDGEPVVPVSWSSHTQPDPIPTEATDSEMNNSFAAQPPEETPFSHVSTPLPGLIYKLGRPPASMEAYSL